jgi:DNA-directed RNA polymerase subunit RPC12/RpoP
MNGMTNQELLLYPNDKLLTGLDSQRRFLLRQAYAKCPCPNCGCKQNQFEASGISIDDWNFSHSDEERKYKCIDCERELLVSVPLFAPGAICWQWRLVYVKLPMRKIG